MKKLELLNLSSMRWLSLTIVVAIITVIGAKYLHGSHALIYPQLNTVIPDDPTQNVPLPGDVDTICKNNTLDDCENSYISAIDAARGVENGETTYTKGHIVLDSRGNPVNDSNGDPVEVHSTGNLPGTPGVGGLNINISVFDTLTPQEQLFVLANAERIDRSIPPISGLTSELDSVAQNAANQPQCTHPADPVTLSSGAKVTGYSASCAIGQRNTFDAHYNWMYNDGPGTNTACHSDAKAADNDCWGHRYNILYDYSKAPLCAVAGDSSTHGAPEYMGVGYAEVINTTFGIPSNGYKVKNQTELFIQSCGGLPAGIYYTWNQALSSGVFTTSYVQPTVSNGGATNTTWPSSKCTNNLGSVLYPGTNLTANTCITSPGNKFQLSLDQGQWLDEWQYNTNDSKFDYFYWYLYYGTPNFSTNKFLSLQSDGNLVYKTGTTTLWAAGSNNRLYNTAAYLPDTLTMLDNGDIQLKNRNGLLIWSVFKGLANNKSATVATAGTYNSQCQGSTLNGSSNQYLTNNTCMVSTNGAYKLYFNAYGHLQIIDSIGNVIWNPNISAVGGTLKIQQDGNLVLYSSTGGVLWASQTDNSGNADKLVLQNDGNLVVISSAGQAVWSWQTGKQYPQPITLSATLNANQSIYPNQVLLTSNYNGLILQLDGNLVEYNSSGASLCNATYFPCNWTNSHPSRLTMQGDGNLVFYNYQNVKIWSSNTQGTGSNDYFVVQPDGNMVVYNSYNQAVWSKNTGRLYPVPPPPPPTNIGTTLGTNQIMWPNQEIVASNGARLVYQPDGNLVDYNSSNVYVWDSKTYGRSLGNLKMQDDGNLVLYNDYGGAMWSSGTNGKGSNNSVTIGGDSNFVINTNHGIPVWALYNGGYYPEYPINSWFPQPAPYLFAHQILAPNQSISTNGYRLTYQPDGNLVEYNSAGQWVWQSYTYGQSAGNLKMQDDGNLVLYNATGVVLWSSKTNGTGGANYLIVQPDSNLVVYTVSGSHVWSRW